MISNVILAKSGRVYTLWLLLFFLSPTLTMAYDPMVPPSYNKEKKDVKVKPRKKIRARDFTLHQIVIYPDRKIAVINGYIVNEGSYLKKALVKKINENTVELRVSGKKKMLSLEAKLPRIRR